MLRTGGSDIREFVLGLSTPKANSCLTNSLSLSSRQHAYRTGTLGTGRIREPVFNLDTYNGFVDRLSFDRPPLYRNDSVLMRSLSRLQSRKQGVLVNNAINLSEASFPPEGNDTLDICQKSI